MVSKEEVLRVLGKFEEIFGAEHLPAGLKAALGLSECITSRKAMPSHVTCSAIILDPSFRVLMVRHIVLDRWLFPGGHIEDDDETLALAARREAAEETGIDPKILSVPTWIPDDTPIDIDGHVIPANPGKGEGEHRHFDFRFVFFSPAAPIKTQGSHAVEWRPLRDISERVAHRIQGRLPPAMRSKTDKREIAQLIGVIREFVYRSDHAQPIGADGRIRISYFLDILSACHNENICKQVAQLLARHIETLVDTKSLDGLIVPKRGNVVLARKVAKLLGLRTAAVRDSILFNRWMEGLVGQGARVLLIDDVSADGEVLLDAIYGARRAGVFVQKIIVLIDRREGDVERIFNLGGIPFQYVYQLSDSEIEDNLRV